METGRVREGCYTQREKSRGRVQHDLFAMAPKRPRLSAAVSPAIGQADRLRPARIRMDWNGAVRPKGSASVRTGCPLNNLGRRIVAKLLQQFAIDLAGLRLASVLLVPPCVPILVPPPLTTLATSPKVLPQRSRCRSVSLSQRTRTTTDGRQTWACLTSSTACRTDRAAIVGWETAACRRSRWPCSACWPTRRSRALATTPTPRNRGRLLRGRAAAPSAAWAISSRASAAEPAWLPAQADLAGS